MPETTVTDQPLPGEIEGTQAVDEQSQIGGDKPPHPEFDKAVNDKDTSQEAPNLGQERRRSKTSRACDQCREKKTKCDFGEDNNNQSCSTCQKLGKSCTFARVPMKRGPIKGYTRQNEGPEPYESGRRGSRKRSSSESFQDDSNKNKNDLVSLPPLNQYLPSSGTQARVHPLVAPGSQPQQQFWKVPYHEYQYQRRDSVNSLTSNSSHRRGSDQFTYAASNASSASPFYPLTQPPFNSQMQHTPMFESESPHDPRVSPNLPTLQRAPSNSGNPSQYPYSQFSISTQQPSQQSYFTVQHHLQQQPLSNGQHFKEFDRGFHSRKNSDVSVALSPSSSIQIPPPQAATIHSIERELPPQTNSFQIDARVEDTTKNQEPSTRPHGSSVSGHKKSTKRSNSTTKRSASHSSGESQISSCHPIVTYGKIPDNQLIDIYFEFIHPSFPVIPINKQTLTDELLMINTQPVSHIHELNCYILHWFRNSLELLVRVALKKPSGSAYDYSDGVVDVFDSQTTFIAALNESFQRVVDIHPRLRENEEILSLKIKFIYLSTFTILNYVLAFVGYDNSFVLGMSVTIYNELKMYRYLMEDEKENEATLSNDEGFHLLFKRLYMILAIFDSLQSCAFGVPKLMSVPLADILPETFSYSVDKWSVELDKSKFESIRQSLMLGDILSRLSMGRKSMSAKISKPGLKIKVEDQPEHGAASLFAQLLLEKHELTESHITLQELKVERISQLCYGICKLVTSMQRLLTAIMRTNPTNSIDPKNRPPLLATDYMTERKPSAPTASATTTATAETDATTTDSDMYKKLLGLNGGAEIELAQGTVSPFIVSMVADVSNTLELVKNVPTVLIGLVVHRLPQTPREESSKESNTRTSEGHSDSQHLVLALSNAMGELVQITSLLALLKPYKMFEHTPRAQRATSKTLSTRLRHKYASVRQQVDGPLAKDSFAPLSDAMWGLLSIQEFGWL
ncbi:LANO_0D04742g1_1 [Lachancea nothofagi CBS 11611]|uniref:LANO_0D04742g1_1 n=1 Tax=Lachancea nothofagi CBS 11611 TaxID=1266666 RepID=A0A1G4JGD0_9SACH|nr:LANO_0D04742g1_1 [Lachancea nothofagi CBS 11611]